MAKALIDYKDKSSGWIKAIKINDIDPLIILFDDPVGFIKERLALANRLEQQPESWRMLRIRKESYSQGFEVGRKSFVSGSSDKLVCWYCGTPQSRLKLSVATFTCKWCNKINRIEVFLDTKPPKKEQ